MTPDTALIRRATEADLEGVLDLWEELLAVHRELDDRAWHVAPDGREKAGEWYRATLTTAERVLLVAETEGRLVGFVHGMLTNPPAPIQQCLRGDVSDLCVTAGCRRRGVGRRLMEAVAEWFAQNGAVEVRLSAAVKNEASMAFYEALGFEPLLCLLTKPLR